MPRLAFHTFALMLGNRSNPVVKGFIDRNPEVIGLARSHPGFIDLAWPAVRDTTITRFDWDYGAWGPFDLARFYTGGRDLAKENAAVTLSLWDSIEAVGHFAYTGKHKEALDLRHEWFLAPQWPSYVMWWVADDTIPTWGDAARALEHLHDHGPTPAAFGFKQAFNADGSPRQAARPA